MVQGCIFGVETQDLQLYSLCTGPLPWLCLLSLARGCFGDIPFSWHPLARGSVMAAAWLSTLPLALGSISGDAKFPICHVSQAVPRSSHQGASLEPLSTPRV